MIEFKEPIKITTIVENWLIRLEFSMKYGVSRTLEQCKNDHMLAEFENWITEWPTHILLSCLEVDFTSRVLNIFPNDNLINHFVSMAGNRRANPPKKTDSP